MSNADAQSGFIKLDDWCKALLESLEPKESQKIMRKLVAELRKQNQKRMTAQKEPDGGAWKERAKPQNNSIAKKKKMMANLRKVKNFKSVVTPNLAYIGWVGFTGIAANEHHYGLKTAKGTQLPSRELLGATEEDQRLIYDILLNMLPN